jgi:hypothetical protein
MSSKSKFKPGIRQHFNWSTRKFSNEPGSAQRNKKRKAERKRRRKGGGS